EVLARDDGFCALAVEGQQVLLLFRRGSRQEPRQTSGGEIPPHDGSGRLHLAFAVDPAELPAWETWLEENQVVIESRVQWERGSQSLYFRDPDGHLVELVTPGLWAVY
ncbi:MAG: glyoxalase, partial [Planctomycetota bacterium]|nr:glyoxalase [Planctomycetota bacterium]